ncbi:S-acyl fatty acid synthase thioesterase, medium chain-like isoform X2 [Tubulanus polymorphus]|uniref:S-acyl fatty acid synthase thioesterase, medium chain-like isoform X2 n=1 Tax=Tubulanus polymorphus TaxID=672921 RepID=UPI003DA5DE6C
MDRLVSCHHINPNSAIRLFCLPWAGGGTYYFRSWANHLPETEVNAIRLPGRENRFVEKNHTSHETLIKEIVDTIGESFKEKKFALFGHSFGGLMCYELAKALKKEYDIEPQHIFVSGASGPQSSSWRKIGTTISNYNDKELIDYLIQVGGTPKEIIENSEMLRLFLPSLKADYKVISKYSCEEAIVQPVLRCPISVIMGIDDERTNTDRIGTPPNAIMTQPFQGEIVICCNINC